YTASMPLLPSALPPKGEARRYVANDFLNLIAFPIEEGFAGGTVFSFLHSSHAKTTVSYERPFLCVLLA
ncbi:MAG: hypothetical protein EGR19_01335, partial [Dialister sp.]|nr:hypothetical protein [Dialister sp.]